MKYIESKPNGAGWDHTEVQNAHEMGCIVFIRHERGDWVSYGQDECPSWFTGYQYRAQVPDTYGIHGSSMTREVCATCKGTCKRTGSFEDWCFACDASGWADHTTLREGGPAVAEMLLDRIKELEDDLTYALDSLDKWACYSNGPDPELDEKLIKARAALNKEKRNGF